MTEKQLGVSGCLLALLLPCMIHCAKLCVYVSLCTLVLTITCGPMFVLCVYIFSNPEQKVCGLECPGRQGVPPSLHCDMCMCLFHPQCVGLYSHYGWLNGFTCWVCNLYYIQFNGFTCWVCIHYSHYSLLCIYSHIGITGFVRLAKQNVKHFLSAS